MKLSQLLKLQALYMIAGVGYNGISYIMLHTAGKTLSTTSPALGATTLLIYGLCLLFGYFGYYKVYRLLMLVALIGFGYAGIFLHMLNFSNIHLYYSFTAWLLAVAINIFGAILNLIALIGKFSTDNCLDDKQTRNKAVH